MLMQFTSITAVVAVGAVVVVAAVIVAEVAAVVVLGLSFFIYKKTNSCVSPNLAWPTMNESSSSSFPENVIKYF